MSDNNSPINKPLIAAGIAGLCILTALITAFFITLFLRMSRNDDTESKKEKETTSSVSETKDTESTDAGLGAAQDFTGGQAYQVLMSLDDLTDEEVKDLYKDILDAYRQAWKDDFDDYDDEGINPNMTKSKLGIPKNLCYAFVDFADDGFPELVVANVDKNGYKVIDFVGIEVDLSTPDRKKSAKRIFDQFPSKSFNLRLVSYHSSKEEEDTDSDSGDETDSKADKEDKENEEEDEERTNLLYTADWDPDSDVRMMDLDILNPRMITTTSFMEIRRRPDLSDGDDDAYTIREGDKEAESVSEEKYTAITYGFMEDSRDYDDIDWISIRDWKG